MTLLNQDNVRKETFLLNWYNDILSFQKFSGVNVYGIVRGGGSGNEAMVLSVPFRSFESPHPTTGPGLALLLAITKYFRSKSVNIVLDNIYIDIQPL